MNDQQPINPYAAPTSAAAAPQGRRPVGAALPWEPMDAFQFGWKRMWENPMCILVIFASSILSQLISIVGMVINLVLSQHGDREVRTIGVVIYALAALINLPIVLWVQGGLVRYVIALARNEPGAGFGTVFSGGFVLSFLGGTLLMALGVTFGMVACFVPGVILALGWYFYGHFVVDRGDGPVECLKSSWRATNGHKVKLFLFMVLAIIAGILGVLACGIGIFIAQPLIAIASAFIYLKLTGEEPAASPRV